MSIKAAVLLVAGGSLLLWTPGIARGQQRPVFQVQSVVASGRSWFAGIGIGAGVGLTLRTGVGLSASFGIKESRAAARSEVLASFHLSPPGFARVNPYLAAGAAFLWAAGGPDREYMVLSLGVERQLGARLRGFGEAGLGGGPRVAAGIRAAL